MSPRLPEGSGFSIAPPITWRDRFAMALSIAILLALIFLAGVAVGAIMVTR